MTGDVNDVMPGSDGLRILEFENNSELRFGLGRCKSISGACRGQTSSLQWGPHVVGSDGKVINERNCVSLSSCRKNLKLKKVIKSFVLEPIASVFGFLCLFHIFISWSYFWTWICYKLCLWIYTPLFKILIQHKGNHKIITLQNLFAKFLKSFL